MATLSREQKLEAQRRMLRIRAFDERASKMVKRGHIPGTVHTSIGQEAQVVGATMALGDADYMTGNHRSHGHPIGKGSPLGPLMAELQGKGTGVCRGKGGSLHLADFNVGSLGESGIVGSSIPIAMGAALSSQVLGRDTVALAFFGDGAANQGVLYESMNMSGVWNLPVIFLCENNQYALSTPAHTVTSGVIADRAAGFGIPFENFAQKLNVTVTSARVARTIAEEQRDRVECENIRCGDTLRQHVRIESALGDVVHGGGLHSQVENRDGAVRLALSRNNIGLFGRHLSRKVTPSHLLARANSLELRCLIQFEFSTREHAGAHSALRANVTRQRASVDARDAYNTFALEVVVKAALCAEIRDDAGWVTHDVTRDPDATRFHVEVIRTRVADVRRRHDDDLP